VRIGVSDDGPGIDAESLAHVFERFRQIGGSFRSGTKGFGLGLSIARELVHLNLGDIDVESNPGEGSTFSFTIPVADPPRLISRYLDRVDDFLRGSSYVSLLEIRTEHPASSSLLDEADRLLHRQTRRSDLIFRRQPRAWLLVAPGDQQDPHHMIQRIKESWQETIRTRPSGRLPTITLRVIGSWRITEQREELVRRVEAELQPPAFTPSVSPGQPAATPDPS
jgi:hypothetical protein